MNKEVNTSAKGHSLGENEDGNEIIFQCPACGQIEFFQANFIGTYDMDGAGCWDDSTKYREMQLAEGEYEFIMCKECGHSSTYAAFHNEHNHP